MRCPHFGVCGKRVEILQEAIVQLEEKEERWERQTAELAEASHVRHST